jgi:hypothetical protein
MEIFGVFMAIWYILGTFVSCMVIWCFYGNFGTFFTVLVGGTRKDLAILLVSFWKMDGMVKLNTTTSWVRISQDESLQCFS